jgi:hypothetical protein
MASRSYMTQYRYTDLESGCEVIVSTSPIDENHLPLPTAATIKERLEVSLKHIDLHPTAVCAAEISDNLRRLNVQVQWVAVSLGGYSAFHEIVD